MTKQDQLVEFLSRHHIAGVPRAPMPAYPMALNPWVTPSPFYLSPRPSAEQIAEELLGSTEFRALQLGTWLSTPAGDVVAHAVEQVLPPFYRADFELVVEGLKLAASIQQREGRRIAGLVALGVVAAGMIALAGD